MAPCSTPGNYTPLSHWLYRALRNIAIVLLFFLLLHYFFFFHPVANSTQISLCRLNIRNGTGFCLLWLSELTHGGRWTSFPSTLWIWKVGMINEQSDVVNNILENTKQGEILGLICSINWMNTSHQTLEGLNTDTYQQTQGNVKETNTQMHRNEQEGDVWH